jgi:hypothetical protein
MALWPHNVSAKATMSATGARAFEARTKAKAKQKVSREAAAVVDRREAANERLSGAERCIALFRGGQRSAALRVRQGGRGAVEQECAQRVVGERRVQDEVAELPCRRPGQPSPAQPCGVAPQPTAWDCRSVTFTVAALWVCNGTVLADSCAAACCTLHVARCTSKVALYMYACMIYAVADSASAHIGRARAGWPQRSTRTVSTRARLDAEPYCEHSR